MFPKGFLAASPSEDWHPSAVARLALTILVLAALLNLIERIILALKVGIVVSTNSIPLCYFF